MVELFVVVGFTNPEGRRPYLGALLLGYHPLDGKLIYAGRVGTGMDQAELKRLFGKLKPLETKTMMVLEPPPRSNRFGSPLKLSEVHWVKPKLVAEIRYLTWTGDGLLRQVMSISGCARTSRREKSLWSGGAETRPRLPKKFGSPSHYRLVCSRGSAPTPFAGQARNLDPPINTLDT